MLRNEKYRSVLFSVLGILSFIATLGSAPMRSAQTSQTTNDILVTLSANQASLAPGGQITFTAVMKNLGPDDATFVDLAFNLPSQLKVVSMTCDLGISPDGPFCEYSSLPAGASVVSKLVATTLGAPLHTKLIKTSASALFENAGILDPDLKNNTASVKTRLIVKSTGP